MQLPGSSHKETPDSEIHPPVVAPMFQVNFGKQGIAFPEGHAYFRRLPEGFAREAREMAREEVRRVIANAEQYMALKDNPEYKNVEFDWTSGGVRGDHVDHNFDKKGGEYEKHVQTAGYKAGHAVILESEKGFDSKRNEGLWDNKQFEVAGRETATPNNILRGLVHCAKTPNTRIAILDFPNGGFDEANIKRGIARYIGYQKVEGFKFIRFDEIICVQEEKIVFKTRI